MATIFHKSALCLVSIFVILALTGCGSKKKAVSFEDDIYFKAPESEKVASKDMSPLVANLIKEARTWIGTPYRYGGAERHGTDCSGFVMQVFKTVTGVSLPRNSAEQYEFCTNIRKEELLPGDLVFFSSGTSKVIGHVGLYVGEGIMIHASSSKGVIESSIETPYYIQHYLKSGRVPLKSSANEKNR